MRESVSTLVPPNTSQPPRSVTLFIVDNRFVETSESVAHGWTMAKASLQGRDIQIEKLEVPIEGIRSLHRIVTPDECDKECDKEFAKTEEPRRSRSRA